MQTQEVIAHLSAWGCDTAGAIARCAEDSEFFLSLLLRYKDTLNFGELRRLIEQNNAEAAFALAHSLKGKLLNLGLTPFCDNIFTVTEALRAGNCEGLLPLVQQLMEKKVTLDQLLGVAEAPRDNTHK